MATTPPNSLPSSPGITPLSSREELVVETPVDAAIKLFSYRRFKEGEDFFCKDETIEAYLSKKAHLATKSPYNILFKFISTQDENILIPEMNAVYTELKAGGVCVVVLDIGENNISEKRITQIFMEIGFVNIRCEYKKETTVSTDHVVLSTRVSNWIAFFGERFPFPL